MANCSTDTFHLKVKPFKAIIQMILGGALAILIGIKLILLVFPPDAGMWHRLAAEPPLRLVGWILAYSAAVELAYMLFTPGPDEAVEPLILGLSATALIVVSAEPFDLNGLVEVVGLALAIGFLFWVRARFVDSLGESSVQSKEPGVESPE